MTTLFTDDQSDDYPPIEPFEELGTRLESAGFPGLAEALKEPPVRSSKDILANIDRHARNYIFLAVLPLTLLILFTASGTWELALPMAPIVLIVVGLQRELRGFKRGYRTATCRAMVLTDRAVKAELRQAEQDEVDLQHREAAWFAGLAKTRPLPEHGFLYVIEYSTGVVKVGQTADPRRRIGEHRRDASAFGVYMTNVWVSPQHVNYLWNELLLIEGCAEISERAKREYFTSLGFDQAVAIAAGLTYHTQEGVSDEHVKH